MITITNEDVTFLQRVAEEEGRKITVEEAREAMQRMVCLYEHVMRPTAEEIVKLQREDFTERNVPPLTVTSSIQRLKRGKRRLRYLPRPHVYLT